MRKTAVVLMITCLVLAAAAFAGDKAKGMSWTGIITDEKCAKGENATNEACAKKCIERDGKAVFVDDKDGSVTPIHNVDAIKGHEGHHVKITGSMMDNAIHVDKVGMVAGGKKAADKKGS